MLDRGLVVSPVGLGGLGGAPSGIFQEAGCFDATNIAGALWF